MEVNDLAMAILPVLIGLLLGTVGFLIWDKRQDRRRRK